MQQSLPQQRREPLPIPVRADAEAAHDHAHPPHRHNDGAFDRIGAVLGFACAVHCIAVPLLLGVLPALGLGFLADHAFDLSIVAIASICALLAARSGYRAHHDGRVVMGFAGAVALLIAGHALGEEALIGRVPSILGGVALAVTHLVNLRLSKRACAHAH